jgi:peroxiredoxin
MNKLFCFTGIIIAFLFTSCSGGNSFRIDGTVAGESVQTVYLERLTGSGSEMIDSSSLSSKGTFVLQVKMNEPGFYSLRNKAGFSIMLAIYPGEKIQIKTEAVSFGKSYQVIGSEDSEKTRILNEKLSQSLDRISSLGVTYQDSLESPNILNIKRGLDSTYRSIIEEQKQYSKQFVLRNPSSLAALLCLYQQIPSANPMQTTSLIDPVKDFYLYALVDSMLMQKYPLSEPVRLLHAQVIDLREQQKENRYGAGQLDAGAVAPDLILPSPMGDTIQLSALRGRYVLLNFWASWSDASRDENQLLKILYQKYHSSGLEIYQVSIDKSKEAWISCIAGSKLPWKHGSDCRYWNSRVVSLYQLHEVPESFVIDREGKIISGNLKGEELTHTLKEVFKF